MTSTHWTLGYSPAFSALYDATLRYEPLLRAGRSNTPGEGLAVRWLWPKLSGTALAAKRVQGAVPHDLPVQPQARHLSVLVQMVFLCTVPSADFLLFLIIALLEPIIGGDSGVKKQFYSEPSNATLLCISEFNCPGQK